MAKKNWYAIYKGDEFVCQGTKEDCARYLGVDVKTISFLATSAYKKRRKNNNGKNYLEAIVVNYEKDND